MANATTKTETKITGVTLELTPMEAYVLSVVLAQVSGLPEDSFRLYTDGISKSLDKASPNLENFESDFARLIEDFIDEGDIHFKTLYEVDERFGPEHYERLAVDAINRG